MMDQFSNAEMADMHLAYGAAGGNGEEARRIYHQRYPERTIPQGRTFAAIDRRLRETGAFEQNKNLFIYLFIL
jgi:hypothetical protein